MNILELKEVNKTYRSGKLEVPVLFDINLQVEQGEMLAIMGPSGSGKSTLMNILGLLDRPTSGHYFIAGEEIKLQMADAKLAHLRAKRIGFVFQVFNLLPRMNALQNVLMPTMYFDHHPNRDERAVKLLEQVGLGKRFKHKPAELSGGEKQRVAIARALINDPDIILADEPTGNLDSKSGKEVMDILKQLNEQGKTIIVITHDTEIARLCKRLVTIRDGRIEGGSHDAR